MAILKVKGIIISENCVNDYDKMLTMLTPNLGKISCSAKGAKRPKSALLAGSQFLCFGEYVVYKNSTNEIYNINSCDIIEVFYNIRTDIDKLNSASKITKIIQKVATENQNSYRILQLYLNTLYIISEKDKNIDLIMSVFKMRLSVILGFAPKIRKCVSCEKKEGLNFFSFKEYGLKCLECSKQDRSGINILESTKNAIQYSISVDPKKLYSFKIPKEAIKELKIIADNWLENIIE